MRLKLAFVLMAVMLLVGCGVMVTPEWAARLDVKAANSRAYAKSVADDATIPPGVRGWIKDQANQDSAISDWANGRPLTTRP